MKEKVLVKDLVPGMFVEDLDRPWLETPYLIQGIAIKSEEDIQELARYCQYVYVSIGKNEPIVVAAPSAKIASPIPIISDENHKTPFHGMHFYRDTQTVEEELPAAKKSHEMAQKIMDKVKKGMERDLKFDIIAAKELVEVIFESIVRNPDAMLLLGKLKSSKSSQYERAINIAVYMIALGRHLCFATDDLAALGLGGLLMDIGRLKISANASFEDAMQRAREANSVDEHVTRGEEMLATMPGVSSKVIQIVSQHHEREDGSGYPRGLRGNEISPYGRMAAIVDAYEKLVFQGLDLYHEPISPFNALKLLWDWSRKWLNATLVQQFAHCVGLFPVGSLVELNSGEIAIVLTHSRSKPLLPRVMVVLNAEKKPSSTPRTLDLASSPATAQGVDYEIIQDLKYGAYGIDPKEYYL